MKKLSFILLVMSLFVLGSCEEDYGALSTNNYPAVPILFPGTTTYGFNPYISIPHNSVDPFQFTLEVPEGNSIKEISKVIGGGTGVNAGSLSGTAYNDAPIPGTSNKVTFTTTLADFREKYPTVNTTAPAAGTEFREIAFIFLVKLGDDSEHISRQVRVRLTN